MSARLFKGEIVEGGIGPYAIEDFHSMGHFASRDWRHQEPR